MDRSVADIDADLTVAYAARRSALRFASVATGDGVSKANQQLSAINDTINILVAEKNAAESAANGAGTLVFIPTFRVL
jgi:hypothetical protein